MSPKATEASTWAGVLAGFVCRDTTSLLDSLAGLYAWMVRLHHVAHTGCSRLSRVLSILLKIRRWNSSFARVPERDELMLSPGLHAGTRLYSSRWSLSSPTGADFQHFAVEFPHSRVLDFVEASAIFPQETVTSEYRSNPPLSA